MTTIPSSDPSTVAEVYKRNVMPTYAPSVVLKRGRGIMVWDADGKKYIDYNVGVTMKWKSLALDASIVGTNLSRSDMSAAFGPANANAFYRMGKAVGVVSLTASF